MTQAEIWGHLVRVAEQRRIGLLVIGHDVALLARVCHRIVALNPSRPDSEAASIETTTMASVVPYRALPKMNAVAPNSEET